MPEIIDEQISVNLCMHPTSIVWRGRQYQVSEVGLHHTTHEGRSSLGRLGIVVHSTASIFEPGWNGVVVMELGNLGRMPVAVYPGMRVCALTFEELSSSSQVPYNKKKAAKYIGQQTPLPSRIGEDQ